MPSGKGKKEHFGVTVVKPFGHIHPYLHYLPLTDLASSQLFFMATLFCVSGRGDILDWKGVSALQWKLARCLLWTFRRNRGQAGDRMFARTMLAFCRVRELCVEFYQWIDSNPFDNYDQFRNNGFLAEWFSD